MNYYLGNFLQVSDPALTYFAPPAGALGCVDLAPLPAMSGSASQRPVGIFWTGGALLSSDYTLLGSGDCRSLLATAAMRSAFKSLVGYQPQGAYLVDLVMDCLTGGSDPAGQTGPLPIVPDADGWLNLWLPGHSKVLADRFAWGKPTSRGRDHTPKLRALLQSQFATLFAQAQAGLLNDNQQHLRVLDAWCDKYGLQGPTDWQQLVPANLLHEVPGRVTHHTTLNDTFNRANQTGLGTSSDGWVWDKISGSTFFNIVSNACSSTNGSEDCERADSDLSSGDQYVQAAITAFSGGTRNTGLLGRKDSTATLTHYLAQHTSSTSVTLYKRVSGTFTQIGSGSYTLVAGDTMRLTCNGSTIEADFNGTAKATVTDTSITGGLRTGIRGDNGFGASQTLDNFQAADLSASSLLYTELERNVRGVERGMYQFNNNGG